MPLVVSGEAAARIARAQHTIKGQTKSSTSLSKTSCSGEPSFELLAAVLSTISPLITSTEHHSRNGSLQGSKTAATASTRTGLTVHDPDAEIIVPGDDLGRLGLYDGSLVRVRFSYTCQVQPMSIQRGTYCPLVSPCKTNMCSAAWRQFPSPHSNRFVEESQLLHNRQTGFSVAALLCAGVQPNST